MLPDVCPGVKIAVTFSPQSRFVSPSEKVPSAENREGGAPKASQRSAGVPMSDDSVSEQSSFAPSSFSLSTPPTWSKWACVSKIQTGRKPIFSIPPPRAAARDRRRARPSRPKSRHTSWRQTPPEKSVSPAFQTSFFRTRPLFFFFPVFVLSDFFLPFSGSSVFFSPRTEQKTFRTEGKTPKLPVDGPIRRRNCKFQDKDVMRCTS